MSEESTLQVGTMRLDVEYLGDVTGRPNYRWTITAPNGESVTDADLNGPRGGMPDAAGAMRALCSFLSDAADEDLPEWALDLIDENVDELAMAGMDPDEIVMGAKYVTEDGTFLTDEDLREQVDAYIADNAAPGESINRDAWHAAFVRDAIRAGGMRYL